MTWLDIRPGEVWLSTGLNVYTRINEASGINITKNKLVPESAINSGSSIVYYRTIAYLAVGLI